MTLYSEGESYKLYHGSMLDMLTEISPNSIDSVVTDPPYELNFMGKGWDNSGIAFQKDTWEKCYEVLKPGGYLLAFGGTRTFHRIAVAIEDAGFEIRDTIMWLYGSGFPKSLNIGKSIEAKLTTGSANTQEFRHLNGEMLDRGNHGYASMQNRQGARPSDYNEIDDKRLGKLEPTTELGQQWDGWGTALKPAYEPIIVARKPCEGSTTDNVLKYGVGGINIEGCRVDHSEPTKTTNRQPKSGAVFNTDTSGYDNTENHMASADPNGRFPSNVILTYDDTDEQEVCGGMPQTESNGGATTMPKMGGGELGVCNYQTLGAERIVTDYRAPSDSGSAARYFYCAKATKKDRDEGLGGFETIQTGELQGGRAEGSAGSIMQNADGGTRVNPYAGAGVPKKNSHPTVKPTELMQYLIRLVTPKGGTVLDPFNGSGSTGKAVMYENYEKRSNYKYIGIELTEQYLPIAKARIEYAQTGVLCGLSDSVAKVVKKKNYKTGGLF